VQFLIKLYMEIKKISWSLSGLSLSGRDRMVVGFTTTYASSAAGRFDCTCILTWTLSNNCSSVFWFWHEADILTWSQASLLMYFFFNSVSKYIKIMTNFKWIKSQKATFSLNLNSFFFRRIMCLARYFTRCYRITT
jgi:hypothetical protein